MRPRRVDLAVRQRRHARFCSAREIFITTSMVRALRMALEEKNIALEKRHLLRKGQRNGSKPIPLGAGNY